MAQRRYFGTDGIRDVANRGHLSTEMILRIGHAVGAVIRAHHRGESRPRVLLVRDTRVSGPMISCLLTGALLSQGIDVYDAGILPTPGCALLVRRRQFQLGIVVSASHNPMQDNGIKLFGPDGRKLTDAVELEIERFIDHAEPVPCTAEGAGIGRLIQDHAAENEYLEAMTGECFANLDLTGLRVVVDCANGAAWRVAPRILASLGAQVTAIHTESDGVHINDHAGVFFAEDLKPVLQKEQAGLGVVLDGDGDRVLLVDETGTVRDGDDILAALTEVIPEHVPRVVVSTVMANMGLKEIATRRELTLHTTPVGDRYVAEKMVETSAWVGGEQSGHVIFHEPSGWFGDGVYTALKVLERRWRPDRGVSTLFSDFVRYPQVLRAVPVREKPPIAEFASLQSRIRVYERDLGEQGRILVRYSGTENVCRIMVEGRDGNMIKNIAALLADHVFGEIGAAERRL